MKTRNERTETSKTAYDASVARAEARQAKREANTAADTNPITDADLELAD